MVVLVTKHDYDGYGDGDNYDGGGYDDYDNACLTHYWQIQ
jgi:hypothetical protein